MELIKGNTSESSLIKKLLSTVSTLRIIQNEKVKEEMINDTYLPVLQSIMYGNEEDKKYLFEGFTNVEMIYYFVHGVAHHSHQPKKQTSP